MTPSHPVCRILDASLNRAAEGLRVCEDFVRFGGEEKFLYEQLKSLRHDLGAAAIELGLAARATARDTLGDVGTDIGLASEAARDDLWSVCQASFERTKQALRSLEEYGKLWSVSWAASIERLRYRLYSIESAVALSWDARRRMAQARLCVLLDGQSSNEELARLAAGLVASGVDMIQLRDKQLSGRELVSRGRTLRHVMRSAKAPKVPDKEPASVEESTLPAIWPLLIVNDRPDVAAAVDADGVHVGQDDLSVADARRVMGPQKLVGVSTHSLSQARQAVLDGANYVGAGPTFFSSTKTFAALAGVAYLSQVAQQIRLPIFAIGGITAANLDAVLAAGVRRAAVGHAITGSDDPFGAAKALAERLASPPAS